MHPRPSELAPLFVLALAACESVPPPDPPDLAQLELTPIASRLGDHVLVLGLPGSTEPRIGVVGLDLDAPLPRASGTVARDGSFLLEVPGSEGHVLRVFTEDQGQRSEPVDVIAAFGAAAAAPSALPCLRAPAHVQLGAPLVIENECEEPVVIDAIALRAPAALEVRASTPLTIEPDQSATIAMERTSTQPIDEVLLVTIGAPVADRRAVMIVGP